MAAKIQAAWQEKSMCKAFLLFHVSLLLVWLPLGCTKVGPNYVRPETRVMANWLESEDDRVKTTPADCRGWWRVFNDPALDRLIETAYRQNLTLWSAGVRVLEARAFLGVALGNRFPQSQQVFGSLEYNRVSENSSFSSFSQSGLKYTQDQIGITANWEIDFWGRFRRAIESADASLMSAVSDYDNALVSLTSDVANTYILIRTLEKRIDIARQNIEIQKQGLEIAEVRVSGGVTTERDVEQARTLLYGTEASIRGLQIQLEQAAHALSILLGRPPSLLPDFLADRSGIPHAPFEIAVGIPADLLRRRPDVRSAEFKAMSQAAQIGVAKAELYPAFSISGTFSFLSTDIGRSSLGDIARWGSREYVIGPAVRWNIFNYGQITNNVRVQDARFQELLINYQNLVLQAQQQVEDGLTAFLRSQEQSEFLARSAEAAKRSVDLAVAQYRTGIADFTTVLTAQQALLSQQDSLVNSLGEISRNLVSVYRALGGGWEIRGGADLVPPEIKETMARRVNWGDLLQPVVPLPASAGERQ